MDSKENAGGDAPRLSGGIVTSVYGQGGRLERWALHAGTSVAAAPGALWPPAAAATAPQRITTYTYDSTGDPLGVVDPDGRKPRRPRGKGGPRRSKRGRAARTERNSGDADPGT